MKKYTYKGPHSGVTLNVGTKEKPKSHDVIFHDGKEYDLPEDHPHVKTLVAQGFLSEQKTETNQETVKTPIVNNKNADKQTEKGEGK